MIINETDLFKGISFEIMEEIADISSEESHAKDTVLFERGEKANCLYILEQGVVHLVIKNGGSLVYTLTEPGEVFGWSSIVEPGLYTASGVCAEDSKVVKIGKDKLDRLFDLHPDAGLKVLRRLGGVFSKRLSNAYQDILSSGGHDTAPSYG
ncbi:Crp/Fnr family transcriptional regulator [Desulfonema magnum]|uniref:Cyclic nucleotide-binding domain-containing protein n=1 Tax=Desulfonema magnum TaxID=45655 RepID=A0A975GJY1_9BACT|nr:cyclic nucleotide-binding domain-containing protein [Desulfonema magnum]QTA84042.1 Cyclic nucleotide-binding domain-containing protein [Desulfonema magnum]